MILPADFDWSTLPTIPLPEPDPVLIDCDAWHPPDYGHEWGPTDFLAGGTNAHVEWMHVARVRNAVLDENTGAAVVEAYRKLPRPQAVETIILAHIAFIHNIAYDWVKRNLGRKAICLEEIGRQALIVERAGKKKPQSVGQSPADRYDAEQAGGAKGGRKGGATIGEDLLGIALLKLVQFVPSLRQVGDELGWDDWAALLYTVNVLEYTVRDEIREFLREEKRDYKDTITYLLDSQIRPKGKTPRMEVPDGIYLVKPRVKRRTKKKGKEVEVEEELLCAAYDGRTPDLILEEQEEPPRPQKDFNDILDCVCKDIFDRLLLGMRGAQVLTETEMGELYGGRENRLGRDAVNRRLHRMHRAIQKELGFDPDFCAKHCRSKSKKKKKGKRCSKQDEKRKLAEEVLASWRCPAKPATYVPAPHFHVERKPISISREYLESVSTDAEAVDLVLLGLRASAQGTCISRCDDVVLRR